MSYSEVTNLIENLGYEAAMKLIYDKHCEAKISLDEAQRRLKEAEFDSSNWYSAAFNFTRCAAQRGIADCEDGSNSVRIINGDDVISFRIGQGEEIFIGTWRLTSFIRKEGDNV